MMMKMIYTMAAVAATAMAANAATYVLYDAAGGGTDPQGGWGWTNEDASVNGVSGDFGDSFGGNDGIAGPGVPSTTTDGNDAWLIGDAVLVNGQGKGDGLLYEFSPAQIADMSANGFTLTVKFEGLNGGGFTSFGANDLFGLTGATRIGQGSGNSGGVTETWTWSYTPGGSVTNDFGATAGGTSAYWAGASGEARLFFADNSQGTDNWEQNIVSATLTTIPEPSSTALLGLGGLALSLRRRK